MKVNKWTLGLAAAGVVSLGSVVQAEEAAHQVLTAVSSTTLSGYVSTSAIWKPGTGTTIPYRAYDGTAKQDGFNLDVINITLSKSVDESDWGAGYKAELLFGPDAATLGTASTAGNGEDFNIKQAYVALRAPVGNGLNFKIGVWDTPIGFETFDHTACANYSRSFGFTLEPTTYTGILMSYKAADGVDLWTGIANNPGSAGGQAIGGSGAGKSLTESEKTYMAGFTLTAPDDWGFLGGSTLSAGVIDHASAGGFGSPSDVLNIYAGSAIKTGVEGLMFGAAFDYQTRSRSGLNVPFYANAMGLYASYQVSEKVKTSLRAEYASGSAAFGPFANAGKAATAHNSKFVGITGTVDYKLWENVITRAEVRWDTDVSGGPVNVYGLAANPDKSALSLALNVIYKF